MTRRHSVVVMAAHFPPPVSGMAIAVQAFADRLETAGVAVVRHSIAGDSLVRSFRNHLQRVRRVASAVRMIHQRRREEVLLYMSCDAGPGIVYTVFLAVIARMLRLDAVVHHHSYAYINRSSLAMRFLVRVAGRRADHIVGCTNMKNRFDQLYVPRGEVVVVPISYAVKVQRVPRHVRGHEMVLGHLSNLSEDKGLQQVFDTVAAARALGVHTRLVVAGPAADDRAGSLLGRCLSEDRSATYLGPLGPAEVSRFYAGMDVFLFPSRYRHESFGLVAGEAMATGVPVIACQVGCLTRSLVGQGGLVVSSFDTFVAEAAAQLFRWYEDPALLDAAGTSAQQRFDGLAEEAGEGFDHFLERWLFGFKAR